MASALAPWAADRRHGVVVAWRLAAARARSDWQYRGSLAMFAFAQVLASAIDLLAMLALFTRIDRLDGWSVDECLLVFGLTQSAFLAADVAIGPVDRVNRRLRAGTFDQLLLRPVGTLVQLAADDFALRRVPRLLASLALVAVAFDRLGLSYDASTLGLIALSIGSGALVYGGIWVAVNSVAFWVIDGTELASSFTYGGGFVTQYPLSILDGWVRRMIVWVIPVAFTGYLPAARLAGRPADLGVPAGVVWWSPLVGLAVAAAGGSLWRIAIRRHRSTGS